MSIAVEPTSSSGVARDVPVSFELFPPRTDAAAIALGRTIDRLAEFHPAFISMTFGAGGSSRDRSLTVLRYILEHTSVEPMAHLTCVGCTHAEANRLVREFLDAGVTSFLALRGDPPSDGSTGLGDLRLGAVVREPLHAAVDPVGDVSRPVPITVEWSTYAQSLTSKPVKGMLTGPVTILAWSFVRDDQPLGATADQVAFALRDEIADLESAGIGVIQVDEPALRELLPLRERDRAAYLEWSVGAFRLATAGVAPRTQVHTHLCYSEFGTVIEAIRGLDADVTSIEAARSRMEIVDDIAASGFDHGIGPGVYDIHSPRVPSTEEVVELIDRALTAVPDRLLWINPDCGLKTRGYDETVASLRNVVDATRRVRARLAVPAP
jgi:methionine synthase II (cobalamin-independent)